MSAEAKVNGSLKFGSPDELDELLGQLRDDEEFAEEFEEAQEQVVRDGTSLKLSIHVHLSNDGNLALQEWLSELVETATEGSVDVWQEDFGDSMFVRMRAGEDEEEEITGPFPG